MEGTRTQARDGGWGWMVVLGSFLAHVISDGILYTFGILLQAIREYFDGSRQSMGLLFSITEAVGYGTGAIVAMLINKYGCRPVGFVGGLVACCGMVLSSFAQSMEFMYFSFGVVAAFGVGMIYLPSIISVTENFEKRRSFAVGIAVSGAGVGTFVFAPLMAHLTYEYGWRGTYVILGGMVLNCSVCAALYRPLRRCDADENAEHNTSGNERVGNTDDVDSFENSRPTSVTDRGDSVSYRPNCIPTSSEQQDVTVQETKTEQALEIHTGDLAEGEENSGRQKWNRNIRKLAHKHIEPSLVVLRQKASLIWVVASFFTSLGSSITLSFLPDVAMLAGHSRENVSFLLSIAGITSTLGRVVIGWVSDKPFVNRPMMFAVNLTVMSVSIALLPLCTINYVVLAGNMAIYGTCYGYRMAQTSVVIAELVGLESLAAGMGLAALTAGVGSMIGAPLGGLMYDLTGTYHLTFFVMGGITFVGAVLHWTVVCTPEYKDSRIRLKHDTAKKREQSKKSARRHET